MKLLKNGELGIYVDSDYVESLNTVELLDEELNNVALVNFEPVARDNDTVVDPSDYMDYLKSRRAALIRQQSRPVISPVSNTTNKSVSKTNTPSHTSDEVIVLKQQLQHSAMIIKKLMGIAKSQSDAINASTVNKQSSIVYSGELDMSVAPANASIKGVFRGVIKDISPENKPSDFINVAVARGLLGDTAAKLIIDGLYHPGMYNDFLNRLEDSNGDFSTTNISDS